MLSVHIWSYLVHRCYAYIPFEMTGSLKFMGTETEAIY